MDEGQANPEGSNEMINQNAGSGNGNSYEMFLGLFFGFYLGFLYF
jgi:hypothetical protein